LLYISKDIELKFLKILRVLAKYSKVFLLLLIKYIFFPTKVVKVYMKKIKTHIYLSYFGGETIGTEK
ncbi:MAG: hypothetical protein J7K36_01230, partial [Archaeoglobaceae archaeon]|nr:hypothetical protein [Archaeoglobaceae archaeon]